MPAPLVNIGARLDGVNLDVATQKPGDFELLVNFDPSRGVYEPRKGWDIIGQVQEWAVKAGSPSRYLLPTSTWTNAAVIGDDPNISAFPYGAGIVETATGNTFLLNITGSVDHDPTKLPYMTVTTGNGKEWPSLQSGYPNFLDDGGSVYVLAQYGNWTYLTNGASVWRWSPTYLLDRVVPYHPENQTSQQIYLLSMKGATIVCEHNGSMVYTGWKQPVYLDVDNAIDVNGDGIITAEDANRDGFRLGPGNLSFQTTPFTICVSDNGLPRCVNVLGCQQIPAKTGITGIASVRGQLVVFTDREMFVLRGSLVTGQFSISKLSSYVGCAAHRSIALGADGILVWLARDGFYTWDGSGLPKPVAEDLDRMFYGDPNVVIPTAWTGLRMVDVAWPQIINAGMLEYASASINILTGYYACALTLGPSPTHNNAIICIDYRKNTQWLWTSQQPGPNANGNAQDNAGTASSTIHTMLVRSTDPQHFYAQGMQLIDAAGTDPSMRYQSCMLVQNGWTDQKMRANRDYRPVNSQFQCVLLTAPLWYGDSSDKELRQVYLRMYAEGLGITNDDSTDLPLLAVLPEQTSLDNLNQAQPETSEQSFELVPFPDAFIP